jgi:hypothetical protein
MTVFLRAKSDHLQFTNFTLRRAAARPRRHHAIISADSVCADPYDNRISAMHTYKVCHVNSLEIADTASCCLATDQSTS